VTWPIRLFFLLHFWKSSASMVSPESTWGRDSPIHLYVVWFAFNNISVILWWSVLLVEETRVPGENHRSAASHWQTLSHNVVSSTPRLNGIWSHNVSDDRPDWIDSHKSNYHTITTYPPMPPPLPPIKPCV
jgi:hypothetical protein